MVRLYAVGAIAAATAKAQDAEYFAADLVPDPRGDTSTWYISFAQLDDNLEMTIDSGTTWVAVAGTVAAGTHTAFTIRVRATDLVNFRAATATTVDYFRVDAERS